ncbi:phosphoglucomutase [Desulfurococcus amylolyticus]|uniref:phosphoglucomutase n=1 Tax=Desulfurococcus amylolyticus TaxID=94694 RepID=UPI0005B21604|nr:phosphoglucomutase [Desulfurococcus amylolyticus]
MRLFGTAGIRMKYPEELDPILAYRIGLSLGRLGLSDTSHLVYDTRTTSHVLVHALVSGITAGGIDASIIGLAPTPVAGYAGLKYKSIGISVTASHNPPEYNGFKFYDVEGYEFTRELEKKIEELVSTPLKPVEWNKSAKSNHDPLPLDNYIKDLVESSTPVKKAWQPKVVIDCANGASYHVTPLVTRLLGGIPITVNCSPDGFFPGRPPEPRKDVLEKLLPLYGSVEPAVILAHDGDADRLAVLDRHAGFIRQDRLLALFAKILLEERRGLVIVSVDTGRVIEEVVEEAGGRLERYILGKTHERVKELGASNVIMAGEPWKLIDTSWGTWVDGVRQAALLVKLIIERGKPLVKILEEEKIPDYPWDRRSYVLDPPEVRVDVYRELVEELKGRLGEPSNIINVDGYRFEYHDGSWVLIRISGTEPKIRLYAEAETLERLREITETVDELVKKIASLKNARVASIMIG